MNQLKPPCPVRVRAQLQPGKEREGQPRDRNTFSVLAISFAMRSIATTASKLSPFSNILCAAGEAVISRCSQRSNAGEGRARRRQRTYLKLIELLQLLHGCHAEGAPIEGQERVKQLRLKTKPNQTKSSQVFQLFENWKLRWETLRRTRKNERTCSKENCKALHFGRPDPRAPISTLLHGSAA